MSRETPFSLARHCVYVWGIPTEAFTFAYLYGVRILEVLRTAR